jgi:hypothetical protein
VRLSHHLTFVSPGILLVLFLLEHPIVAPKEFLKPTQRWPAICSGFQRPFAIKTASLMNKESGKSLNYHGLCFGFVLSLIAPHFLVSKQLFSQSSSVLMVISRCFVLADEYWWVHSIL